VNAIPQPDGEVTYAREVAMRDAYADELSRYRPGEHVVSKEGLPGLTRRRADLFTVDRFDLLRVWEFKIRATPDALGQLLIYLWLCRNHYGGSRIIRPVLAAATFNPELPPAIEGLNLGIEIVQLPPAVLNAGDIPFARPEGHLGVFAF
jgi:hypothetical protein